MKSQICEYCKRPYDDFPSHHSKYCGRDCYFKSKGSRLVEGMKKCSKCGETKPVADFCKDKRNETGLKSNCRICARKMTEIWRQNNTAHIAKYRRESPLRFSWELKTKYNLTVDQYQNMVLTQNGKCAICHEETELQVDHCHKTNRVRGLLCFKCNIAIAHFNDSPYLLAEATKYLEACSV